VFDLFRFDSFFSVWYWVLTITVWTFVCQRTLGVPHDMVMRAARLPQVAERVETLALIAAERRAGLAEAMAAPLAAATGFALAGLGALGFWSGSEVAAAALMLLLPLSLVVLAETRLAYHVRAGKLRGETLRRRLARRRTMNQTIAIAAMLAAAVLALGHPPRGVL
jgi:hypothetical protein